MEKHAAKHTKPTKEFPPKMFGDGGEQVFDNRVQIRDEQSGRLIKTQPYAIHKFGSNTLMERPIGSGNMFNQHDEPIGKWKLEKDGSWSKVGDEHSSAPAYQMVGTVDDLLTKNAELEAELAALKAEKAPKEALKEEADKAAHHKAAHHKKN